MEAQQNNKISEKNRHGLPVRSICLLRQNGIDTIDSAIEFFKGFEFAPGKTPNYGKSTYLNTMDVLGLTPISKAELSIEYAIRLLESYGYKVSKP